MPAFLTYPSYKPVFVLLVIAISSIAVVKAQCPLTKKTERGIAVITTAENYQYLRTEKKYDAIAIKSILDKKPNGNLFAIEIAYTCNTTKETAQGLIINFDDGEALPLKLKLIKSKRIDNAKLNTKIFTTALDNAAVTSLSLKPVKDIEVIKAAGSTKIPVNDPSLMRDQITCLQNEL